MDCSVKMDFNLEESSIFRCPFAFIDKRGEPILIKLLSEKSHDSLTQLYLDYEPKNSFNGLPPERKEACRAWVRNTIETGMNLVAMSYEHGLVGHAAIFPMNNGMCEFFVAIAPEHQRFGIGSQLTRTSVQLSYELNFERAWLSVESGNHIARHVYSKCGFQYVTHNDIDELEMTLDLTCYYQTMNAPIAGVMNPNVISIQLGTSCLLAMETCLKHHIAALPVVDGENKVVGIISETDLLKLANIRQKVSDVFTKAVVTVHENSNIGKVVRLFESKRLRYLPVIDKESKLIGIVGRRDILSYYLTQFRMNEDPQFEEAVLGSGPM